MLWKWLHLSDLHCGRSGYNWFWPRMRQSLFEDLAQLHERTGSWDLILFSGDLVQQGTREEFAQLDELLGLLLAHLAKLGSKPVLLAVPGNHDLQRPTPVPPNLQQWALSQHIPDDFWEKSDSDERKAVSNAFANYESWWRNNALRPRQVHDGLLPGDFTCTLEREGARLGIMGLNTTFMQLADGTRKGQLGLHVAQFQQASPERDGVAWANRHSVCLLMTHQPPDWLMPEALESLRREIAPPEQFAVHLFGHMHESRYVSTAEGGWTPRTHWQAHSLFGLEKYNTGAVTSGRIHGYCAGQMRIVPEELSAEIIFWPRIAQPTQGGPLRMVADTSCKLVDGLHTPPLRVPLLGTTGAAAPASIPRNAEKPAAAPARHDGVQIDLRSTRTRDLDIDSTHRVDLTVSGSELRDITILKR